jgi:hypothetical protein
MSDNDTYAFKLPAVQSLNLASQCHNIGKLRKYIKKRSYRRIFDNFKLDQRTFPASGGTHKYKNTFPKVCEFCTTPYLYVELAKQISIHKN